MNEIALNTRGGRHTSPVTGLDVTTNTVAPNVGTVFTSLPSLYGEHLEGVNAASMVATLRKKFAGFKGANILVVNPPAVKGLGSAGGFKMMLEDRAELGPQALAEATNKLVAAARKDPAFRCGLSRSTTLAPQCLCRHRSRKGRESRSFYRRYLSRHLNSTWARSM